MTDPVILLGTQSNGETLPVQVDAFGRLVAEGLEGARGPEGPQGPEGPEGPPGPGGLPEGGEEGQVLQIVNGVPTWETLHIGPSLKWSDYLRGKNNSINDISNPANAFDGIASTYARTKETSQLIWKPPVEIQIISLEVSYSQASLNPGYTFETESAGIQQTFPVESDPNHWYYFTRLAGVTLGPSTPLVLYLRDNSRNLSNTGISRLRINNNVLIDFAPARFAKIVNHLKSQKD